MGVAVVLRPGRVTTLKALRAQGATQLSAKWLPETAVFMAEIPKGPTGKPARIGLAARLQLPTLREGDRGTWDVGDYVPGDKGVVPARALEEPLSPKRSPLSAFLAVESDPAPQAGILSLTGLQAAAARSIF